MSTDTEQTAAPNRKSRLGTVALLFALVLPVMPLLASLCGKLGRLPALSMMGFPVIIMSTCPLLAIICGFVARTKAVKGKRTDYAAIILGILQLVVILSMAAVHEAREQVRQVNSYMNLKQLHALMTIYADNFNCYPSMQPTNSVPRCNGGVRDLYPLYLSMLDKEQFLVLLRPRGVKLVPFSKNPSPNEFDTNHIGYIYNSTVVPDQSNNVPLMAERCVEDGMFTEDEKPVFKDCAHILMANGDVRQVPVKNGKLILPNDIKLEDLGKLK